MRLLRRRVGHRSHHHGVKTPPRLGPDYAALHRTASLPELRCAHAHGRQGGGAPPACLSGWDPQRPFACISGCRICAGPARPSVGTDCSAKYAWKSCLDHHRVGWR